MADQPSFLGTGWGFPPTFTVERKGVVMVSDVEDICESLEILLHTRLGERVMQPGYGANLKDQLFEPMNASVATYIEDLVRTAIIYHEPRIKADAITVTPEQLEGILRISIDYTVRSTNTRFNIVFPFFLEEGSEVT